MVKGLHLAEAFRIQHSGLMVNLYVGFTRNPEPKAQNAKGLWAGLGVWGFSIWTIFKRAVL